MGADRFDALSRRLSALPTRRATLRALLGVAFVKFATPTAGAAVAA